MVGLKNGHIRKKSHPKVVNPRDIAGERKKKKKKKTHPKTQKTPVTSKLALQWRPCQMPGVIESALGLNGPVSVYCDWVRYKV